MTKKELITLIEKIVDKAIESRISKLERRKAFESIKPKTINEIYPTVTYSPKKLNAKIYSTNPTLNEILSNTMPLGNDGPPSYLLDNDDHDVPIVRQNKKIVNEQPIIPETIEGRPIPMTEATKDVLSIINRDYSKLVEKMK